MELLPIPEAGELVTPVHDLSEYARDVLVLTAGLYRTSGYQPPWIAYLALEDGAWVGTCAFKSPPDGGQVEIAYWTFPGHEHRGVATWMAERLIHVARKALPDVIVRAQTLPEENGSNAILKKLGFTFHGEQHHPDDGIVWEWRLDADRANRPNVQAFDERRRPGTPRRTTPDPTKRSGS